MSNGHQWIERFGLTCCATCGIVRRADDQNQPCKGSARVGPRAEDIRQRCDWPEGDFYFVDSPGEHDPCYVVMPGGAMIPLNHHAGEGVDIARAKFIIDACNKMLAS